jgi:hypothetical protein
MEGIETEVKWAPEYWSFVGSFLLKRSVWVWSSQYCGSVPFVYLRARAGDPKDKVAHVCIGNVIGYIAVDIKTHLDVDRVADWHAKMINLTMIEDQQEDEKKASSTLILDVAASANDTQVTSMKEIPSEMKKIVIENEKEVVSIGVIKSFEETPNFTNASSLTIGMHE